MLRPQRGDVLIRRSFNGYIVLDAVTHAVLGGPVTSFDAALGVAKDFGAEKVWSQPLDATGSLSEEAFAFTAHSSAPNAAPSECESDDPPVIYRHEHDAAAPATAMPVNGDVRLRGAADGQFAVCHWESGRVLSTHDALLDAVVACHALANAYSVNVWQEVDSDGNLLPEPRRLYTRRSEP